MHMSKILHSSKFIIKLKSRTFVVYASSVCPFYLRIWTLTKRGEEAHDILMQIIKKQCFEH